MAMGEMKHAQNTRKALIIVSDGGDNRSRHTAREIKNAMLESDLQVYAMGIFDPEDAPKHSLEEQNGPKLLEELADESGGREYPVTNLNDLPSISARIGDQLRNQYLLGYMPINSERDGKYRIINVRVTRQTQNTRLTRVLSAWVLLARLVTLLALVTLLPAEAERYGNVVAPLAVVHENMNVASLGENLSVPFGAQCHTHARVETRLVDRILVAGVGITSGKEPVAEWGHHARWAPRSFGTSDKGHRRRWHKGRSGSWASGAQSDRW